MRNIKFIVYDGFQFQPSCKAMVIAAASAEEAIKLAKSRNVKCPVVEKMPSYKGILPEFVSTELSLEIDPETLHKTLRDMDNWYDHDKLYVETSFSGYVTKNPPIPPVRY